MKLFLARKYKKGTYTIGILSIDGKYFCETLEDTDRGLKQTMSLQEIREKKIYGETAIPAGEYNIRMDVLSPKYKAVSWYNSLCKGYMPRLENVPGFDGILLHPGTTAIDTLGCILVGQNKAKGKVLNSRETFKKLYAKLKAANERGESITIKIL